MYVVLIAAFGVILATNLNEEGSFGVRAPNCPIVPPGSDAVTVPNVDDCSTFYICDTNGATLAPCLNGTWFNPTVGVSIYSKFNINQNIFMMPYWFLSIVLGV